MSHGVNYLSSGPTPRDEIYKATTIDIETESNESKVSVSFVRDPFERFTALCSVVITI